MKSHPLWFLGAASVVASCVGHMASRPVVDSAAQTTSAAVPRPLPMQMLEPLALRSVEELDRPFGGDLVFEVQTGATAAPVQVTSCRTLLELPFSNDWAIEPEDERSIQDFWTTAVDCFALSLMQSAQPSRESRVGELLSAPDISQLLPPEFGLTDFADDRASVREAAAACRSWKAYDRSVQITKQGAGKFSVRADIWSGEVVIYARADFDADGFEDLLVQRNGQADGGSYAASTLFILSRTAGDPCIRASKVFGRS